MRQRSLIVHSFRTSRDSLGYTLLQLHTWGFCLPPLLSKCGLSQSVFVSLCGSVFMDRISSRRLPPTPTMYSLQKTPLIAYINFLDIIFFILQLTYLLYYLYYNSLMLPYIFTFFFFTLRFKKRKDKKSNSTKTQIQRES